MAEQPAQTMDEASAADMAAALAAGETAGGAEAGGGPGGAPQAAAPPASDMPRKGERTQVQTLDFILDIPLKVTVELGRTKMMVRDILQLAQGSVIELS